MAEGGNPAMIALGDQVQQACTESGLPIFGFVLLGYNGNVEYRAQLSIEDFRIALAKIAEAL